MGCNMRGVYFNSARSALPSINACAMQLVKGSNCSAYDCEFVALAQYLDVPLITADKKILREFPDIARNIGSYIK